MQKAFEAVQVVGHLDCGFAGQLADHFAGADVAYSHHRYRDIFVDRKPGQGRAEDLNLEGGGAVRGTKHVGRLCCAVALGGGDSKVSVSCVRPWC